MDGIHPRGMATWVVPRGAAAARACRPDVSAAGFPGAATDALLRASQGSHADRLAPACQRLAAEDSLPVTRDARQSAKRCDILAWIMSRLGVRNNVSTVAKARPPATDEAS